MSGSLLFTAPTTGLTVNGGQVNFAPITLGLYPREGGRSVGAVYDWTSVTAYTEDLSGFVSQDVESTPQAAWIDNSACRAVATLYIPATGQVLTIPPGAQRMVPLIFSGTPQLVISVPSLTGVGAGATRVLYQNVPAPTGDYPGSDTNGAGVVNTAGNQPTFYSSSGLFATGATPQIVSSLNLSAFASTGTIGKRASIKRVRISTDTAGFAQLARAPTNATGGTSNAMGVLRGDFSDPAQSATAFFYTAVPAPPSLTNIDGAFLNANSTVEFAYTNHQGQGFGGFYFVLFNTAANLSVTWIWTEYPT